MTPTREQIGRILYECEKKRGQHADAVMKGISPKASDALLMEPWEECKDSFLSDADAVLSLFGSAAKQDMTEVQAVAAAILPVVDRIGAFTSEDRALEIAKLAVAALPRSAASSATDLLAWLRDETSLELSFERWEEDGRWQVHEIRGGRNDQEWSLLGSGDTPEQALSAAKIALEVRKDAKAATRARNDRGSEAQ